MRNVSLAIAAAGLVLATQPARAADRALDAYVARATADAAARVGAAGVDLTAQSLAVQGRIASDGRLGALRVVRSSGSIEADVKAVQALRTLRVADPPAGLVGAQLKVTLGEGPILQAKAQ